MINAQAVLAQLLKLGALPSNEPEAKHVAETEWLEGELAQAAVQHRRDAAGNYWITLPGMNQHSVVLGSYLRNGRLDSQLGLVAGLEVLKAIARREGRPPCTLTCVVWAESLDAQSRGEAVAAALREENVAAYLELHVKPAAEQQTGALPDGAMEPAVFSPRLMALCDEAVRELTGASAASSAGTAPAAAAIAQAGIPAGVMTIEVPAATGGQSAEIDTRLHLLEAAEAFGRWAESTLHLVAGEDVDLWAREHRLPHTEISEHGN